MNRLGMLLVLACAFAFGETWTGKLMDADCHSKDAMSARNPTAPTSSFLFQVSGKGYTFDQEGNRKAAEAIRNSASGAERSKNPNEKGGGDMTATVSGTLRGQQIQVSTITVH